MYAGAAPPALLPVARRRIAAWPRARGRQPLRAAPAGLAVASCRAASSVSSIVRRVMQEPKWYFIPRLAVFSASVTGAFAFFDVLNSQLRWWRGEADKWLADWDAAPEAPDAPATPAEEAFLTAKQLRAAEKRSERIGRRYVVFVRHAQPAEGACDGSDGAPAGPPLTEAGRRQAELTGRRLQELFGRGRGTLSSSGVSVVYHSSAPEAAATAEIIRGCFTGGCNLLESPLLAEGVPALPSPAPQALAILDPEEIALDRAGAEGAFRAHLWKPGGTDQDAISVDVLVSHGNLIRYLVCRALQLPPVAWGRLATHHCAVTWLDVSSDGTVALREFGGVGHLPADAVTYR